MTNRLFQIKINNLLSGYKLNSNLKNRRFTCTIYKDAESAVKDIPNGSKLLVGGFGLSGIPEKLIEAVGKLNKRELTIVSNNAGTEKYGIGILFNNKQVKKMIGSHIGSNKECSRQYLSGELELELIPQGTIVEKLRSGGAGIPAFFTHSGYNTWIHHGKLPEKYNKDGTVERHSKKREVRDFNGREYLLEESITADYALIKAWKADRYGNIIFNKAAANLNSPMARAAKITIVEVEEIVEVGEIPPENVHIASIYVDRLVKGDKYVKPIERLAYRDSTSDTLKTYKKSELTLREIIGQRLACELKDDMYVNIGIGIPEALSDFIPKGVKMLFQSENGILGMGPKPLKEEVDADLVNAGKETTSVIKGGSFFPSDESFAMIRGGHVSITILGGMEVSQYGDLANWIIPRKLVKGIGGAMDLVSSPMTDVIIALEHCTKEGKSKILEECTLPLTGYRVVKKIVTEKAVFEVSVTEGLTLVEKLSTLSIDDIAKVTGCQFKVSPNLSDMKNIIFGTI